MSDHSKPDDYIYAVGLATVNWALVETSLDFLVAATFNGFGGHPKHPEIPRSLTRKLTYLRDVAENENLAAWRGNILNIAKAVEFLKEQRHDAVHGVALHEAEGKITLLRVLYEKTMHRVPKTETSTAQIMVLARAAEPLAHRILRVTGRLIPVIEESRNKTAG